MKKIQVEKPVVRKLIEAEQNYRVRSETSVSLIKIFNHIEHIADKSGLNAGMCIERRREGLEGIVETITAWLHAEKEPSSTEEPDWEGRPLQTEPVERPDPIP